MCLLGQLVCWFWEVKLIFFGFPFGSWFGSNCSVWGGREILSTTFEVGRQFCINWEEISVLTSLQMNTAMLTIFEQFSFLFFRQATASILSFHFENAKLNFPLS